MTGSIASTAQAEFKKFPMWMRHPAERPAVISDDYQGGSGTGRAINAPTGQPLRFPPVMVLDEENEEYHRAQGYEAVGGNPTAYMRAVTAPEPKGYVHNEYPKYLPDGTIDIGPDAPTPPDNFYPYYVRMDGYEPTLVMDRDAHQALLENRGSSMPPPADAVDDEIAELEKKLADLRAKKAELPAPEIYTVTLVPMVPPAPIARESATPRAESSERLANGVDVSLGFPPTEQPAEPKRRGRKPKAAP